MHRFIVLPAVIAIVGCRAAQSAPPPSPAPMTATPAPVSTNASEKLEVARQLRAAGAFLVNLDPRKPGVDVPERFRKEKRLVLEYGDDLEPPIPDLVLREDGISATLSFSHVLVKTFVPWSAVFAIVDEDSHGKMWKEDLPSDLELGDPNEKM
jgi:hypothetical protein